MARPLLHYFGGLKILSGKRLAAKSWAKHLMRTTIDRIQKESGEKGVISGTIN